MSAYMSKLSTFYFVQPLILNKWICILSLLYSFSPLHVCLLDILTVALYRWWGCSYGDELPVDNQLVLVVNYVDITVKLLFSILNICNLTYIIQNHVMKLNAPCKRVLCTEINLPRDQPVTVSYTLDIAVKIICDFLQLTAFSTMVEALTASGLSSPLPLFPVDVLELFLCGVTVCGVLLCFSNSWHRGARWVTFSKLDIPLSISQSQHGSLPFFKKSKKKQNKLWTVMDTYFG